MPYGSGPLVRTAMARATPWQRYLIAVAMVLGGAALVAFGRTTGVLLAVAGVFVLVRMIRYRATRARAEATVPSTGNHAGGEAR